MKQVQLLKAIVSPEVLLNQNSIHIPIRTVLAFFNDSSHTFTTDSNKLKAQYNMKKIVLLSFLIIFFLLPVKAIKKITANPINVAVSLVEKTDSSQIVADLNYYGYTPQNTNNGTSEFYHENGSIINFIMPTTKVKDEFPTIEVKSNSSGNEINNVLKELRFKKVGNHYERDTSKYDKYITKFIPEPSGIMIIRRIKKENPNN